MPCPLPVFSPQAEFLFARRPEIVLISDPSSSEALLQLSPTLFSGIPHNTLPFKSNPDFTPQKLRVGRSGWTFQAPFALSRSWCLLASPRPGASCLSLLFRAAAARRQSWVKSHGTPADTDCFSERRLPSPFAWALVCGTLHHGVMVTVFFHFVLLFVSSDAVPSWRCLLDGKAPGPEGTLDRTFRWSLPPSSVCFYSYRAWSVWTLFWDNRRSSSQRSVSPVVAPGSFSFRALLPESTRVGWIWFVTLFSSLPGKPSFPAFSLGVLSVRIYSRVPVAPLFNASFFFLTPLPPHPVGLFLDLPALDWGVWMLGASHDVVFFDLWFWSLLARTSSPLFWKCFCKKVSQKVVISPW